MAFPQINLSADTALKTAIAAELVYIGGRALIRSNIQGMIAAEIVTTAWRLVVLAFYIWLYFDALKSAWLAPARRAMHPFLTMTMAASILMVLVGGYWHNQNVATMLVFALTTPVVAAREEIFYRFILQNGLERRMNSFAAVCLSSLLFVLYHIGSQPMNLGVIISIGSFGLLLGVIYQRTRSLRLIVAIHLAVDLAFIASIKIISPISVLLGDTVIFFAVLLAWSVDTSRERMGL